MGLAKFVWLLSYTVCIPLEIPGYSDSLKTGFGTFLPIILKDGFNYTTKQAQYLTIPGKQMRHRAGRSMLTLPVNLWGAIVYGIGAVLSDRYNARYLVIVASIPFGIAGYAILLAFNVPIGVLYFAMFLVATPCFLATGGNIAWLSSNCAPDGKRAASLGIQLTLTNLGGIIAGQIYQSTSEPRYVLGHSWSLGSLAIAFIGCSIMRVIYHRREKSKDEARTKLACGEDSGVPELWHPTDRGLDFKYLL